MSNNYDYTRDYLVDKLGYNVADNLSKASVMEIAALLFESNLEQKEYEIKDELDVEEVDEDLDKDGYDDLVGKATANVTYVHPEIKRYSSIDADSTVNKIPNIDEIGNTGTLYILSKEVFNSIKQDIITNADNLKNVKFVSKGEYIGVIVQDGKTFGINPTRLYLYSLVVARLDTGKIVKEKSPHLTREIFK